jgi:hypothetical protein
MNRPIECDYIIHQHEFGFNENAKIPDFPYTDEIKKLYKKISEESFIHSQASMNLTVLEFADDFFFNNIDTDSERDIYNQLETLTEWPSWFKKKNFDWNKSISTVKEVTVVQRAKKDGTLEVIESSDVLSIDEKWTSFVLKEWMLKRKECFFKKLVEKDFVRDLLKESFNFVVKKPQDILEIESFLVSKFSENPKGHIYVKMSMVQCLSIYLCGMICCSKYEKDEDDCYPGESLVNLRKLVKTNGVSPEHVIPVEFHSVDWKR